jgi:hypothetical protein
MTGYEFRGKRKDTGEWARGHGFFIDNAAAGNPVYVYSDGDCKWHEVIPETVGRYTGFTAGEEICEGDIGSYQFVGSEERVGKVEWKDGRWALGSIGSLYSVLQFLKIIGNFHDSPELLLERLDE